MAYCWLNVGFQSQICGQRCQSRNVAGYFEVATDTELILYSVDERKKVRVDIKGVDVAYSAAGGDGSIRELKSGIQMRVWYVGCRAPKKGMPKAAYIEFFSNDPLDIPSSDYLMHNGR